MLPPATTLRVGEISRKKGAHIPVQRLLHRFVNQKRHAVSDNKKLMTLMYVQRFRREIGKLSGHRHGRLMPRERYCQLHITPL